MGLKIWKPTCPSCGGGLDIREGQLYVQCENCQSSLIIEGWETRPKPPAKVPSEDYKSWPTETTFRFDDKCNQIILEDERKSFNFYQDWEEDK